MGGTPQPAGKDQKLSREFEGGALISAEGAVPSSVDSITNNRLTGNSDCPPIQLLPATDSKIILKTRAASIIQRKTGRGAGQSPAVQSRRTATCSFTPTALTDSILPYTLNDSHIAAFIKFFQTLDRWDEEAHGPQVM